MKESQKDIYAVAFTAIIIVIAIAVFRVFPVARYGVDVEENVESVFTAEELELISAPDSLMRVLTINEPEDSLVLRKVSSDCSESELKSEHLRTLITKMMATVKSPEQDGVGIAGPQVGISRRLVVVQRYDKENYPFEAYCNVRIDSLYGGTVVGGEGCLSVPGKRGDVTRSAKVRISYMDLGTLTQVTDTVSGFSAVIFQHECDHLDGILYIDRSDNVTDVSE